MKPYAKVVVPGSPISKSNFKLHNKDGRAILPYNTGKAHDNMPYMRKRLLIMLEVKILLPY